MSVDVSELEITIDGKGIKNLLDNYKDEDGESFSSSFENGYYPVFRDDRRYNDEYIIGLIMKDYPNSEIFYRIITDYGEEAYRAKDGKIKHLKKEWR